MGLPSGGGRRQLWAPDQSDPLLDVVGDHRPEALGSDFGESAQAQAPQPQFLFQPCIGELSHFRSFPVVLLIRFGLHLLAERGQDRIRFATHHGSPRTESRRTTLHFVRTTGAIAALGPVFMFDATALSWSLRNMDQQLPFRAAIGVLIAVVTESFLAVGLADAALLGLCPRHRHHIGYRPDQFYAALLALLEVIRAHISTIH